MFTFFCPHRPDAPVCKPDQKTVYGLGIGESARVLCDVDASSSLEQANSKSSSSSFSSPVLFHWTFNGTQLSSTRAKIVSNGLRSSLAYTPLSRDQFGQLACWARNEMGIQREPCLFSIIPAGRPENVHSCLVSNVTANSLAATCEPGYDGGLGQKFNAEVWELTRSVDGAREPRLQTNLTNARRPAWEFDGLVPDREYRLQLYASNAKGTSPEKVTLNVRTASVPSYSAGSADSQPVLDLANPATYAGSGYQAIGLISNNGMLVALIGTVIAVFVICLVKRKPSGSASGSEDGSIPPPPPPPGSRRKSSKQQNGKNQHGNEPILKPRDNQTSRSPHRKIAPPHGIEQILKSDDRKFLLDNSGPILSDAGPILTATRSLGTVLPSHATDDTLYYMTWLSNTDTHNPPSIDSQLMPGNVPALQRPQSALPAAGYLTLQHPGRKSSSSRANIPLNATLQRRTKNSNIDYDHGTPQPLSAMTTHKGDNLIISEMNNLSLPLISNQGAGHVMQLMDLFYHHHGDASNGENVMEASHVTLDDIPSFAYVTSQDHFDRYAAQNPDIIPTHQAGSGSAASSLVGGVGGSMQHASGGYNALLLPSSPSRSSQQTTTVQQQQQPSLMTCKTISKMRQTRDYGILGGGGGGLGVVNSNSSPSGSSLCSGMTDLPPKPMVGPKGKLGSASSSTTHLRHLAGQYDKISAAGGGSGSRPASRVSITNQQRRSASSAAQYNHNPQQLPLATNHNNQSSSVGYQPVVIGTERLNHSPRVKIYAQSSKHHASHKSAQNASTNSLTATLVNNENVSQMTNQPVSSSNSVVNESNFMTLTQQQHNTVAGGAGLRSVSFYEPASSLGIHDVYDQQHGQLGHGTTSNDHLDDQLFLYTDCVTAAAHQHQTETGETTEMLESSSAAGQPSEYPEYQVTFAATINHNQSLPGSIFVNAQTGPITELVKSNQSSHHSYGMVVNSSQQQQQQVSNPSTQQSSSAASAQYPHSTPV